MVESRHLKISDYTVQPWKNGQGETREIARDEKKSFRWRLSWAKLATSGPFSDYPGYDRVLVLLHGGPLTLSHQGKPERQVQPLRPYSFKGEWETQAVVTAPGEDFNLFTLQGKARAGVYPTYLSGNEELQFPVAGHEHFLFCVEGEFEAMDQNTEQAFTLTRRETFQLSRRSKEEFLNIRVRGKSPQIQLLWVVIHLL